MNFSSRTKKYLSKTQAWLPKLCLAKMHITRVSAVHQPLLLDSMSGTKYYCAKKMACGKLYLTNIPMNFGKQSEIQAVLLRKFWKTWQYLQLRQTLPLKGYYKQARFAEFRQIKRPRNTIGKVPKNMRLNMLKHTTRNIFILIPEIQLTHGEIVRISFRRLFMKVAIFPWHIATPIKVIFVRPINPVMQVGIIQISLIAALPGCGWTDFIFLSLMNILFLMMALLDVK